MTPLRIPALGFSTTIEGGACQVSPLRPGFHIMYVEDDARRSSTSFVTALQASNEKAS